uniref:short-chain fatty acid transporter n=1 Tax=Halomonas sp. TaxID=1486246 RepID=UPI0026391C3A|nr:short-chain fatty acid transporter [Halomonas sp.]
MLRALSRPAVKLVERYLPDPYIFVLLLTLIAAVAAIAIQHKSPLAVIDYWGNGFWSLLQFSMQMLLVLVTGYMLASSPPVKRLLDHLASYAKNAGAAVVLVTLVSLIASWINWGFGLVVGALFAKALARQVKVDYRLLVASAYSGFIVWHGGLAGSVPLTIATEGHFMQESIGIVSTADTIFSYFNLILVAALFVAVPLVNRLMLPSESESIYVDPALLGAEEEPRVRITRPAERLENSMTLAMLVGLPGLIYLISYFVSGGGLNLNVVNFLFLFLAIVLHRTPQSLLNSLQEAIKGGAGIVIQFPFYAGIMAIMVQSGLAETLSQAMISFATETTLPFWTFISAGVVNMFVPSGGGQWAVQAPVVVPAAQALGVDIPRAAMAVAWGDAWTNLLQPFWALPVLGIAGLKAKDIMGFCLIQLFVTGAIIGACLTWL